MQALNSSAKNYYSNETMRKACYNGYMAGFGECSPSSGNQPDKIQPKFCHRYVKKSPPTKSKLNYVMASRLVEKKFGCSLIKRLANIFPPFKKFIVSGIYMIQKGIICEKNSLEDELKKSERHINWITEEMAALRAATIHEDFSAYVSEDVRKHYQPEPYEPISNDPCTFDDDEQREEAISLLKHTALPAWRVYCKELDNRILEANHNLTLMRRKKAKSSR